MTEPQVWTLIGVFAAAVFGMQGILISSIRREMRYGFAAMDSKFAAMDAKFESIEKRLDLLDRDVQGIVRREFDK